MNFVFIFFSSVLLLGGLNFFLNDEVIIIPLQNQSTTFQVSNSNENNVDQYEVDYPASTEIMKTLRTQLQTSGTTENVDALEHFVLANKAREQNNVEDAILHLMNALLIDPGYNDARLSLVENLLTNGQRALAMETLDQALMQNDDTPVFVAMRARMLVQDGNLEDASSMLSNALARFKSDEELLVLAASIDNQLGDYFSAAKLYKQLTIINPVNLSYQVGQAMAVDQTGDSSTATTLYQTIAQKLEESGTKLPFVHLRLAMLTSNQDQTTVQ